MVKGRQTFGQEKTFWPNVNILLPIEKVNVWAQRPAAINKPTGRCDY